MSDVVLLPELMALLRYRDRDSFRAWRVRAEKEEGFPPPLPHRRRPLAWSRASVLRWIDGDEHPRAPAPANDAGPADAPPADELAAARARLMARTLAGADR
jgi:hypothetical protein